MGAYINPPDQSKENWLIQNAKEIYGSLELEIEDFDRLKSSGFLLVCLVNNGPFTAAGISISQREAEYFNHESDIRPKKWFRVETEKLYPVSNLDYYLPKHK